MQKLILTFFCLMLSLITATAQTGETKTVTGTVFDENNDPLPGVTISIQGMKQGGTVSDINGNFSIKVPVETEAITALFIGYEKQTVKVKDKNKVKIKMSVAINELDEVVAIGYGSVKRSDVTGSVSKVDGDLFDDNPTTNPAELLQGQMSGVEVTTQSGELGGNVQIRVRGAASLNADASPLYVIDGVPMEEIDEDNPQGIAGINPQDIKSIEVLKDAASAAIYGSRGANGVILITTKLPQKAQPTTVQFNASYSLQQLERKVDVMDADEWMASASKYIDATYVNKYGYLGATAEDDYGTRMGIVGKFNSAYFKDPRWANGGRGVGVITYTDSKGVEHEVDDYVGNLKKVDWQDEFYRLAPMQSYNLTLSGATDVTRFRASVGYTNQDGIVRGTNNKKLNANLNLETKFLKRFTFGINVAPSLGWLSGVNTSGKFSLAATVLRKAPVVEEDNGGLYQSAYPYPAYTWGGTAMSPIAYADDYDYSRNTLGVKTTAFIRADVFDGLQAEVQGSFSAGSSQIKSFVPGTVQSGWGTAGPSANTKASMRKTNSEKYLIQGTLKYLKTFNEKHTVNALLGISLEHRKGNYSYVAAKDFPDNEKQSFNLNDETITSATYVTQTPTKLMSYFTRFQYSYDSRYIISGSMRWDGSSRFGADNRFSFFPAVSAAWRIDQEKFWTNMIGKSKWWNQMKLRVSWGSSGNNRIDNSAAKALLNNTNYSWNGTIATGYSPATPDNPLLSWEKTQSWNFALDMGWLKNRLQLTVEYYNKTTKDMLYKRAIPAITGFSSAWTNIGNIRNEGVEFDVKTTNIKTKSFAWQTIFTAGYNRNTVLDLGENDMIMCGRPTGTQIFQIGQPLRAYYLYEAVGVYQTEEDLRKYPCMTDSQVGDLRFKDQNGDGVIDENDRTIVGKPTPDWTFGMTNKLKYKDWEFSFVITAQTGGKIWNILSENMDYQGMNLGQYNTYKWWSDAWYYENDPGDGKTPSVYSNSGAIASCYSTRWLYSTDFIKLKNITLAYNFPQFNKKSTYIKGLRLYLSIQNVAMWDKYDAGYSPETNNSTWKEQADYNYGSHPLSRIYTLGASLSF